MTEPGRPQDRIHHAAASGYRTVAELYERGRPEYPVEAVQHLIAELHIGPNSTVLDLGCGTGKLTKLLAPTGAQLIAVDPVEGMRRKLSELLPTAKVLEGTAEKIPLPDHSVDAVVVAQAFHWFDGHAALVEICRVLKARGRLGLIWNVRDESSPWVEQLTQIIDPYEADTPR